MASRLTFKGNVTSASWTPDGKRIVYTQAGELSSIAADGSGREELLFRDDTQIGTPTLTADGTRLLFQTVQPQTGYDIWSLSPQTRQTSPWLSTTFREGAPRISPNGRWVACASNESGRSEIYVRALAASGVKTQVSREGGRGPLWSEDGLELFFLEKAALMTARVTTAGDAFESGRPTALFKLRRMPNDDGMIYGAAPDGRSFVVIEPVTTYVPSVAHLISGWSREVQRTVPVK